MSIYKERQSVIAQLLTDLMLTDAERAEIAGCSTKTVQRVRVKLGGEPDKEHSVPQSNEPILQRFQRHLEKQLPVEECGDELLKLIRQNEHYPTKLAAIKRYQELLGIVTLREAKKVEETRPQGPLMIFPPGSQPILRVSSPHALDDKTSESEPIEAEVVRVEEDDDDR